MNGTIAAAFVFCILMSFVEFLRDGLKKRVWWALLDLLLAVWWASQLIAFVNSLG